MFRSNSGFVFHDSCCFGAGGEDEDEATCLGERIWEGIERVHPCDMAGNHIHETLLEYAHSEPLAHPAVYPALFERVTSDPS
jgi:hypothetical protein